MARSEQDREDLMREATALVERIELQVDDTTVVVGFRAGGAASIFFNADPVFQFNSQNELRRAFFAGKMLKAENGKLVELDRQRTSAAVVLLRRELTNEECARVTARFEQHRQQLLARIHEGRFTISAQVPADGPVLARVKAWIEALSVPLAIAFSARVA